MLRSIFALGITGICAAGAMGQALNAVPVHEHPVWQQVQAVQGTNVVQSGQAPMLEVKSMQSHQVLGWVPVGYQFLSFGSSSGITTMAFNGEIGYLPSSAVARLYPSTTPPAGPPAGPVSLETLAEEYVQRVETGAGVSLQADSSIVQEVKDKESALQLTGTGTAAVSPYGDVGAMDPYNPQPGAALATGGPQGIENMVRPPMGK